MTPTSSSSSSSSFSSKKWNKWQSLTKRWLILKRNVRCGFTERASCTQGDVWILQGGWAVTSSLQADWLMVMTMMAAATAVVMCQSWWSKGLSTGLVSLLVPPHPQSGGASSHGGRERGYHGNRGSFSAASLAGVDCSPELWMRAWNQLSSPADDTVLSHALSGGGDGFICIAIKTCWRCNYYGLHWLVLITLLLVVDRDCPWGWSINWRDMYMLVLGW